MTDEIWRINKDTHIHIVVFWILFEYINFFFLGGYHFSLYILIEHFQKDNLSLS